MQSLSAKIVHLFPACGARPANQDWRRREMSRDIQSLQELANQLHHMKAPLRQASDTFIKASAPDIRSDAEVKLGDLDMLVAALGASMNALVEAMIMHQGPAADDARIH